MHIALASARFYPHKGGIETHMLEVGRRLVAKGHEVSVFTTTTEPNIPRISSFEGMSVIRFPAWPRGIDVHFPKGLGPGYFSGIDLVHVQGYQAGMAPTACLCAISKRIPFVLTFHGGGHPQAWRTRLRPLHLRLMAPIFSRAQSLIATAEFEPAAYSKLLGVSREKFDYVPNGADLPSRVNPTGLCQQKPEELGATKTILSIGRLERYKGHQHAIEGIALLNKRAPGYKLHILGDGPFRDELHQLARRLNVSQCVEINSVSRDQIGKLILSSAAVCLLSDFETHPMAALEAINLGRPVLVQQNSGLVELVDKGWALGVRSTRGEDVAYALEEATSGRFSPPFIELPSWDDCVNQLELIYQKSIEDCSKVK